MEARKKLDRWTFIINSDKGRPVYSKPLNSPSVVAHKKALDTYAEREIERELSDDAYWGDE